MKEQEKSEELTIYAHALKIPQNHNKKTQQVPNHPKTINNNGISSKNRFESGQKNLNKRENEVSNDENDEKQEVQKERRSTERVRNKRQWFTINSLQGCDPMTSVQPRIL